MPELPEVEHFRAILQPLAEHRAPLTLQRLGGSPPRKWLLSDAEIAEISGRCCCVDVRRKGKLLCLVLEGLPGGQDGPKTTKYLFLHMGMTGRVTSPGRITRLENVKDDGAAFPPPYTYLLLQTAGTRAAPGGYPVAFSDPRKFSACQLGDTLAPFEELAPDALEGWDESEVAARFADLSQSLGIKALLLDQRRLLSGVGNWVADELLYQAGVHPEQKRLEPPQARALLRLLRTILEEAVACLHRDDLYPEDWLFHYRWTKKRAGKDGQGRPITFVTAGGRTSAIVASIQKLRQTAAHIDLDPSDVSVAGGKRAVVQQLESEEIVVETKSTTRQSNGQKPRKKRK